MTWECAHELDVVDAAATGRWPDRVDADLRAHVAGCRICADVAEVAPLLRADRDAAWQEADVPAASTVWWRAQMRVRREAAEQVARPMVLVQRAALAYAAAAVFGLGVLLGPWIRAWAGAAVRFLEWIVPSRESLAGLMATTDTHLLPLAALALCLLLAPVVVYFAIADVDSEDQDVRRVQR